MKNTLFGQLGSKIKNNALVAVLMAAVAAAGIFSYNTINRINQQLENQHLQNIDSTPSPQPTEDVQQVQTPQNNVPLPNAQTEQKKPQKEVQAEPEEIPVVEDVKPKFVLPVAGKIYAAFSGEELVYNRTLDDWRTHNGVDITAPKGDAVHAGADGTVKAVYTDGMLGTVVEVDHGDFTARYCGLAEKTFVKEGDTVKQNESIGTVGEITMEVAEESHIHLEISRDGQTVNPDTVLK
ncbi:MAG: peptidoglycan DD-metalloendopeptidase family protein [Oscillospiraceae bacterium]|nr:peptidoglycan DD-metalloendopeptidase family protein [Oscillospiraceae bacterium]